MDRVKIDEPERINNLDLLIRIEPVLNKSEIARRLETCPSVQTLVSRLNRHSNLNQNVEQRAFAQEITNLLNEVFYELGVGLGHLRRDPHKKYRYFFNDDSERMKDPIGQVEEAVKETND